jgi:GDP-D-mannose dehydratase
LTKRALVTGVTGQDGTYLSQFLLEKGYEVHGVVRRSSHRGVEDHRLRWLDISSKRHLHDADLIDLSSLLRTIEDARPDECVSACNFLMTFFKRNLRASSAYRRSGKERKKISEAGVRTPA